MNVRAAGDRPQSVALCAARWAVLWLVVCALPLAAQRGGGRGGGGGGFNQYFGGADDFYAPPDFHGNPAYTGRFTFARIKYRGFAHFSREGPGWSHDYPDADEHLVRILRELTAIRPYVGGGKLLGGAIVALDDPQLFRYPISYLSEPGGWFPNAAEMKGMHDYLLKGGFVIFDDFDARSDWPNAMQQMQRILPGLRPVQLTGQEPIFDGFFKIDLKLIARQCEANRRSCYRGLPAYYGWYEQNDPKKRLLALANVNSDIGEFWQWSAQGFAPVDVSNEAYKLGVNYLIYALTH